MPIGAASGITAAQPRSSSLRQTMGSSMQYGSTVKPSSTRSLAAASVCLVVGKERLRIADDLELDEIGEPELAREAAGAHRLVGRGAARRVGQER